MASVRNCFPNWGLKSWKATMQEHYDDLTLHRRTQPISMLNLGGHTV